MRTLCFSVIVFLSSSFVMSQLSQAVTPQTVEISSGALHLKAFLWVPPGPGPFPAVLFNHGSGDTDAGHTAGLPITEAAEKLGPLFVKHGYAFLYLFRRGQGLSADQAPFMQDILRRDETSKGKEARQHLQFVLLTTEQLDDVTAALTSWKRCQESTPSVLRSWDIPSVGSSLYLLLSGAKWCGLPSPSLLPPVLGNARLNCASDC